MADKFRNWLSNISNRVIFGILILIFSFLFFISIFSTCVIWYDHELIYFILDASVFFLVGFVGLILFLTKKKSVLLSILSKEKQIIGIATVLWCVLLVGLILNTDIEMIFDQEYLYNSIFDFINGNYSVWEMGDYIYDYPFHNGIILLYTPIMTIFGQKTYWAVQFINMLFFWLLAVACYKLAKKQFDNIVAVITYVGILFFWPLWGYVKYFYGNLPAVSLAIWAVYLILVFKDKLKWRYAFGSAACMLAAIVYKNNLLIYAVAVVLVLLTESILKKKFSYFAATAVMIVAVFCGSKGPAWIMHEITGQVTDQGIPSIDWVAIGLQESYVAPGWHNGDSVKRFEENGYSRERSAAMAWDRINESLELFKKEKFYALRFFVRKTASIWNTPDFEGFALIRKGNERGTLAYWMKDILYNGGIINSILLIEMNIMHSIYLFGLLSYVIYFRKKKDLFGLIPLIAFIGAFLFHIVWEAKCQYTIIYFIGLLPYAFAGYRYTITAMRNWLQDKKQKWFQKKNYRRYCGAVAVLLLITMIGTILTYSLRLSGDEMDFLWQHKHKSYWRRADFIRDMQDW